MNDDPRSLTFSQRMGVAPLPSQAEAGTIHERTRAQVWVVILGWLMACNPNGLVYNNVRPPTVHTLLRWWVNHKHQMVDEVPNSYAKWKEILKAEVRGSYLDLYDLLQFLLNDIDFDKNDELAEALENTQAAYRVVDGLIVPAVSEAETELIKTASRDIGDRSASGAESHFRKAAERLTSGDWPGAVHESVSAVESAARFVSRDERAVLSDIVKKMAKDDRIRHGCLRDVILKIYGYASDERGVRHSQGSLASQNVSEREALYLFGLCASTVSYLLSSPSAA